MSAARPLALLLSLSVASLACHAGAKGDAASAAPAVAAPAGDAPTASPAADVPAVEAPAVEVPVTMEAAVAVETPAAPNPASAQPAGAHVLVLKDGRRIDCLDAPVMGMGRVMYKSLDGVTHAISEQIVDTQATKLQSAPTAAPTSAPEAPSVPDFEAVRADGTKVRLSDLKGKVVLVDFWATWCGPCIREMPTVKAAYTKLAGPNFEILGVSLDQDRARMTAYIEEQGLAWPQYFDGKGWGNSVARAWGVNSIPTAVLLDKQGKVAKVGLRGAELEVAVAALLAK